MIIFVKLQLVNQKINMLRNNKIKHSVLISVINKTLLQKLQLNNVKILVIVKLNIIFNLNKEMLNVNIVKILQDVCNIEILINLVNI